MSEPSKSQLGSTRLQIEIEPFGPEHDRTAFSCGNLYIDTQLHRHVLALHEMRLTRAFVAVEPGRKEVLGFYAMTPHEIEAYRVPKHWEHLISQHSLSAIPAVYIALFATRERSQGRGIGRAMMGDALRRIRKTAELALPIFAVVLDAADQKAFDFYESIGFMHFGDGMRMYYRVSDIP